MASIKFIAELGLLARNRVINTISSICFQNGVKLEVREGKGILSRLVRFKITSEDDKILKTLEQLKQLKKAIEDKEESGFNRSSFFISFDFHVF